ncbi:MAG: glycogen synthase [Verrucomicrobia bacterium]|nr:glycogen synthase [Verrucomicrobiota bacterium]
MKILHVTPELAPWSKAGGLGDATAALAKALGASGHDVKAVTPLYGSVPGRERMSVLMPSLRVGVGGPPEKAACRVLSLQASKGFEAWFIEHDDYYGAKEVYPARADFAERAAFYARAALDACLASGWIPDVIHCHDWTAGLVPPLLNTVLKESPLGGAVSVLSIHNLQHQGVAHRGIMDFLGLPGWLWQPSELECLGGVNFLKGGVLHAARVITVSPTYAREILTPAFGHGLEAVVRRRESALEGILNGVDTDEWNPRTDRLIAAPFSPRSMKGKEECRLALAREFGLRDDPKAPPIFGVVSRLWDQKGLDLAAAALPSFLRDGRLRFVLLGSGDGGLEGAFRALAAGFPSLCGVRIGLDHGLSHRIEAGSDFFLMPSRFEPCGLNQMYSMAYGTPPVVRATGGLADTVRPWSPGATDATGIVFEHADLQGVEWAIGRALELFSDPKAYRKVQLNGMRTEFSWKLSADRHVTAYRAAGAHG